VDFSGYTMLTEAFVNRHGTLHGADRMTFWLNQAYDCLIELIHRFGGCVVGFSGDAMTCWFDGDSGHRACIAALKMRDAVESLSKECTDIEKVQPLAIKVSIASGLVQRLTVGKPEFRLYDLLAGRILEHTATGEHLAQRNEIILHRSTCQAMGSDVKVVPIHDGSGQQRDDFFLFKRLSVEVSPQPWSLEYNSQIRAEQLLPWLHFPVFESINAGQDDYLAELRRCVSLFLKFEGFQDGQQGFLSERRLAEFLASVQDILNHYGGYLIQLTVGDKGSYLYAAFGAPVGHDNDPQRAVSAAQDLMLTLSVNPETNPRIGLAHGLMRTGAYGGQSRRTYGVLGDAANTAARLMSKAEIGQVLMIRGLALAVSRTSSVSKIGSLILKGKNKPLDIYELNWAEKRGFRRTLSSHRSHITTHFNEHVGAIAATSVMGRDKERQVIQEFIHKKNDSPRLLIVEGDAGIGKSTLIREIFAKEKELRSSVLFGSGDSVEVGTSFFPWRSIFSAILEPDFEDLSLKERRKRILDRLGPEHHSRSPLLESVLPLDWPENTGTTSLIGEARGDQTLDLLAALLFSESEEQKLFFVIEDVHWIDSASWRLIRRLYHQLTNVCFVLTLRPVTEAISADFEYLKNRRETVILKLSALTHGAICNLICRNLSVKSLPESIARLIIEKAEGHPLFSEEFAYSLRDSGILLIENGECSIDDPQRDLNSIDFPDTVQGIVTSRLDSLNMDELLTLKVASVVGRNFSFGIVADTFPSTTTTAALQKNIRVLLEKDLVRPAPGLGNGHFKFKHAITQMAVYNMLLQTQRQQLHRAAAEWIEQQADEDMASLYPLLAHHWCQAVESREADPANLRKAIQYLELAAAQAENLFANHEAIGFYKKLIVLDALLGEARPAIQQSNWSGQLGRAYYEMGLLTDSRGFLQEALKILGYVTSQTQALPSTRSGDQLFLQAIKATHDVTFEQDDAIREEVKAAMRWYQALGSIDMLEARAVDALHCAIAMLSLAERVGLCVESMAAFGFICLTAGLVPAPTAAQAYNAKCLHAIDQIGTCPDDDGSVYLLLGLYHCSAGHWENARAILEHGSVHAKTIGSSRRWEECQGLLGMVDICVSEYSSAAVRFQSIYDSGLRRGDLGSQTWGTSGIIEAGLREGINASERELLIPRALQLLEESINPPDEMRLCGVLARLCWATGDKKQAFELALRGSHHMENAVPTLVYTFDGWTAMVAVILWAWEEQLAGVQKYQIEDQEWTRMLIQIFKILDQMASLFPISKARILLYKGLFQLLSEQPQAARLTLDASLAQARRLGMCYDEALILMEIGRKSPVASNKREVNLGMARDMFAQIGAIEYLQRCEELLAHEQ
jgi:class 3 adenylate cyclase/tetratricopeptide (TPR) repeat protein